MANNIEEITLHVSENSPYVIGARAYVEQTENGAVITIVDKEGTTTATVTNGRGIVSATLNADYTLTLVYTDGTSVTTSSIRGATGESGVYCGSEEPSNPDVDVWIDPTGDPYPMEDEIAEAVDDWITAHPEYVTTVQDGAITVPKFAAGVVDTALNKTGYPADSKATGDAIAADRTRLTAVEGEADALDARITSLATLTEGSTTGDAELIDARTVGSTTYASLHQAIDTEFTNVKSNLGAVYDISGITWVTGKTNVDGTIDSGYTTDKATDFIPVFAPSTIYIKEADIREYRYICGYDQNKQFKSILGGNDPTASTRTNVTVNIPENIYYIRFTRYQAATINYFEYRAINTTIYNMWSNIISGFLTLDINKSAKIPDNSDLDDYTTNGNYYVSSVASANTIDNIPTKYGGKLAVFQTNASANKMQVYITSTNRIFIRVTSSGTWQSWRELVNETTLARATTLASNLYECARTYYEYSKFGYFTYGALGAFHYGDGGVQRQLNCSTFAALVVGGIPFYLSRYIDPDKPNRYYTANYGFNFYAYARKLVEDGDATEIAYLGEYAYEMPDELVTHGFYQHTWLQAQALDRWGLTFDILDGGVIDETKLQVGDLVYYGTIDPPEDVEHPEERMLNGYYITHCNVITEVGLNGQRQSLDGGMMPIINRGISNFVPDYYDYAIGARVPLTHY